ncbi:MAG: RND transporter, partial [Dehalococcoidia bacterium]
IKGIENDTIVEISSPALKIDDLLIIEGAYGLMDSTIVKVEK